ncbi:MAG: DUF2784 domain-containing protein [Desulfobacteraceae bacterium]|nr:DUF2784 domain-containing protein [Desulfobacteraceae bacterium]
MIWRFLADFVVIIHFAFIVFVVIGGLLVLWSKRFAWIHVPCVLWAVFIEFSGWICPLTPLENLLREKGGSGVYNQGFVEHYVVALIYPEFLTRNLQIVLGLSVAVINLMIYWRVFRNNSE